jgi:hypothetical protein
MIGMASRAARLAGAKSWLRRHEQTLLIVNAVNIALLFLMHVFTTTVPAFSQQVSDVVNAIAIALAAFILATIAWKGMVPAVICALGIVLMHNAIILPYYPPSDPVFPDFMLKSKDYAKSSAATSAQVASTMHFFLGLGMVGMATAIAYRPKFLFARNRPGDDPEWSKYPLWHDNVKLVGGHSEPSVPAQSLMEDRDRYLMWRYEYVLASIYGSLHLVRPTGLVPKKSTMFVRDRESGLLVGKARYSGYFT